MSITLQFKEAYENNKLEDMLNIQQNWQNFIPQSESDANFYLANAILYGLLLPENMDNPLVYKLMQGNFETGTSGKFKPDNQDLHEWFVSTAESVVSKYSNEDERTSEFKSVDETSNSSNINYNQMTKNNTIVNNTLHNSTRNTKIAFVILILIIFSILFYFLI